MTQETIDNFGFIISRKVTNEKQNRYWNQCVKCIRRLYPFKRIIIIDDNSNRDFLRPDHNYINLTVIASEFPGAGELLPYYYFYKYHFFHSAVIIHDSVFLHTRIPFEKYLGIKVLPFWHFDPDKENVVNSLHLAGRLKNNMPVKRLLSENMDVPLLGMGNSQWYGCFGVQSMIRHDFLSSLQTKYGIFQLLAVVKTRPDRCCLERIFGILFHLESKETKKLRSLFGIIFQYIKWGYTFDQYVLDGKQGKIPKPVIKVWSGR